MPTLCAPEVAAEGSSPKVRSSHDDSDAGDGMCDGLKFESEQRGDLVIQPPSPVPGGLERDPSGTRAGFRNRLYEGSDHTAEASTRRQSGALAGRCVLHPPHSTLLLPSAEPADSWIIGNTEAIQKGVLRNSDWLRGRAGKQAETLCS